ncbi:MAG: hypothetical protein J4G19_05510, partial [Pseudomonadales bacterium]|nr:hypothetical protein [Pseudomonadales bacterium]
MEDGALLLYCDSEYQMPPLLIKNVELDGQRVDVRCRQQNVSEISACLSPRGDERVLEGHGGAL